jgi:DNA-directed RNA polymerase subunit RPC12/RpoP
MAERKERELLVQICLECGKEYMFEDREPPEDLKCEKCGNGVFRSFYANPVEDEVERDFREATERDTATDDPATDVTRGDLQDLGNF